MPPVLSPPRVTGSHAQSSRLETLRAALRTHLGSRRFQNWFGDGSRLSLNGASLTVCAHSPYLVKWIQRSESDLLQIAASIVGPDVTLSYEVGAPSAPTAAKGNASESAKPTLTIAQPASAEPAVTQSSVSRQTSSSPSAQSVHGRGKRVYALADFVVGDCNSLAMAGVQQFLSDPESVAPLYLHGGVGNGKTHLLEGLRMRLRKESPHLQVLHLTAEHFGNYFTQALGARSLPSFRMKFRSADVLLIDDVDFFNGKKGFQEEFLHTLKHFEQQGRSVAMTSNRHPRLLGETSEELVSRFLSGLVCRIEAPDETTRYEIVKRRVSKLKTRFTTDSLEHVAKRFTSNVRELEGAVNVLSTWSQMSSSRVTVQVARKLLGRLERDCVRMIRVGDVEAAVCEFFGMSPEELRSKSRKQSISQPRMFAMYLSRKLTQSAYSEIGAHFGGRNHSTVMSAEKKIASQLNSDDTLKVASENWTIQDLLQTLEERIKAA